MLRTKPEEQQANAWKRVYDLCHELGMGAETSKTGIEQVLEFITDRCQEEESVHCTCYCEMGNHASWCDLEVYRDKISKRKEPRVTRFPITGKH